MIAVEPPHPPLDDAALELLAQYFGIGFAEKPELWSLLQPVSLAGGQWLFRQDDATSIARLPPSRWPMSLNRSTALGRQRRPHTAAPGT